MLLEIDLTVNLYDLLSMRDQGSSLDAACKSAENKNKIINAINSITIIELQHLSIVCFTFN